MEMHVTLQGVLTKGKICDIDVWFVYNSTIIFFKNAAEHKTRGNVKRWGKQETGPERSFDSSDFLDILGSYIKILYRTKLLNTVQWEDTKGTIFFLNFLL